MVDHRYWLHKARQVLAERDEQRRRDGLPPRRPVVPWQPQERSSGDGLAARKRIQDAIDQRRKDRSE